MQRTTGIESREMWKAWSGPDAVIVPGRTRADAREKARARGVEPEVLVQAGGFGECFAEQDAMRLLKSGWK